MISIVLVAGLAACGPVTPELAADRCEDRAYAALGPTGKVAFGFGSRSGFRTEYKIGISSDYIAGRSPRDVYEQCVLNLTGQPPIRPLRL